MKKLQLKIESIHVESFAMDRAEPLRGTVNAHSNTFEPPTVWACGSGQVCYTNPDYTVTCYAENHTCACQHTA